jgi:hypothetical protein
MGTSVTGQANNYFTAGFKKLPAATVKAGVLSGANYAYDAVITLALAQTYAKSTNGTVVAKDMMKVTNPPGTKCYSYKSCVTLLKAGKKINYEGASGSIDFNMHHNTFGPYAPFVANASTGLEVQGTPFSAKVLSDVTNCTGTTACDALLRADGIK